MFIVVDTNAIYSSLLSKGKAFKVFWLNLFLNKFEFVAPEFIFFEIGKHFSDIVFRSKLSKEELSEVFEFIKEQIEIIPLEEFNMFKDKAEKLAPHPKDIQYFASSLALDKSPIWSQERGFKEQEEIKIFNTNDLLNELE